MLDQDSVVAAPSVRLVGEAVKVSVGAGLFTVSVAESEPVPPVPEQDKT